MNEPFVSWKWSDGSYHEKSPRILSKPNQKKIALETYIDLETIKENSAYVQSLEVENQAWIPQVEMKQPLVEMKQPLVEMKQPFGENKREDSYSKIEQREKIPQMGQNPFMTKNNYSDDIGKSMWIPESTTQEKLGSNA